jgi:hypothetical protein
VFGVLNTLVSLASFVPIIVVGSIADFVGVTAVIMLCAIVVATTAIASFFLAPAMPSGGVPPDSYQPTDPVTVATQSTTLTAPIPVKVRERSEGPSPIDYRAPTPAPRPVPVDDAEEGGA